MRSSLEDALARLSSVVADLRRSPLTLALIAVCVLVVAVGPLALSLARQDEYRASSSTAQSADLPRYTHAQEVARVKLIMGASIGSPDLQRVVAGEVAWLESRQEVVERVTLTARWREGRPEAVITARAPTPDDARMLAGAVTRALSERADLRSDGRAFDPPTPVRVDKRPVDSVLSALPGRLPPRPAPLWAAVAGVALAAALVLAFLALGPLNGQRPLDAAL